MNENLTVLPRFFDLPYNVTTIGTTYPSSDYKIYRKNSSILCIEYVISGNVIIDQGNQKLIAAAGDTYLLAVGETHNYYSDKNNQCEKIWINSTGLLADNLPHIYGLNKTSIFKNCDSSQLIYEMHNICKNDLISYEKKQNLCAKKFFELIQFLSINNLNNKLFETETQVLKYYIDSHIKENITLKNLADLIPCSVSQLMRIFKVAFNRTPYDYILSQKISMAKMLLKTTNLRVKEISAELSFSDEHYFSTIFKQKVGCTALNYKKAHTSHK